MTRVRLLVETTFHPDAGGCRRRDEVFDLTPDLADHWIRNGIAADATGQELSVPIVAPADELEQWPEMPTTTPTLEHAVVNSDDRPKVSVRKLGPRKQRRGNVKA